MARGPLMPMPTTAMAATAHTAMARGLLMLSLLPLLRPSLRLMPTTAMVDTALAMVVTATARGLLRLTTAMAAMAPTAMAAMAHTAMARGPLMPMLTMAMAAMAHTAMARGPLMPTPTTAMAVTAHTAMARGLLMPMPTTATVMARGPLMLTTDLATAMAAMAHTTDKLQTVSKREDTSEIKPKFVCCFQKCQELI